MISETLPLSEHELIGATECAAIAHRVLGLRSHWTRRSSGEFYSLGAASYLDATRGPEPYLAAARVTNKLLLDHFGGLYDRIVAFFRELLDEEVSLDVERAAPGFHVFVLRGEDRSGDNPARRAHFDHQWRLAYPGARPEGTLSFTLAIATPSGGAGMALWPLRCDQPDRSSRDAWSRTLEQTPQLVPYAPGRMVLHDGLMLHAIGAAPAARATGHRITLQGHGVRFGGQWRLYW
jgi:hypothetical protein